MNAHIGTLIASRYRVQSIIGSGGVGTVYRAIQEPLDRPVALKMLRPEVSHSPTVRRSFVREARAVAALSHPNIAMVHDFGTTDDNLLYLALEFVEGRPLSTLVREDEPDFPRLREIFDQVLGGLAHAHARGVIHRDIKPANILIASDADGNALVKLVDFGIATVNGFDWSDESDGDQASKIVGTPHFMAPEQARGERHLAATVDVYTVALTLYWSLCGMHAFDGATLNDVLDAQVNAATPPLRPRPGVTVPDGLESLIRDALEKSTNKRVPSANVFRARLRLIGGDAERIDDAAASPRVPSPDAGTLVARKHHTLLEPGGNTLREDADLDADRSSLETDAATTASGPTHRRMTAVIGRDHDRTRLLEIAFRAFHESKGCIITLEGPAGFGKSTLAQWFRTQLTEQADCLVGQGSFHRDGERGLRGIREAFESVLDIRGLEASRAAQIVAAKMSQWDLLEARDLGTLTGFFRPELGAQGEHSGPSAEGLSEILLRMLERLAAERPTLLVVDDVHWAGPETATLLEYFAAELVHRPCRVIILVTIQTDDIRTPSVESALMQLGRLHGQSIHRIVLNALDESGSRDLVDALIDATPELVNALVQRAGGNPMHIVQLVRYLVDERLLDARNGRWSARADVDVTKLLPPGLADIIRLRVEQVANHASAGDRLRALLDRAAILGRSFRFGVLERMLAIENRSELLESLDGDIDILLDEELLRMTETREDDILAFPTSLIRDVLLDRLENRRTTRRLHLFAADAKLSVLGEDSEKIAADLVEHFAAARDRRRELRYSRVAAELADRSHRPHDAVTYTQRALALMDELGDAGPDVAVQRHMLQLRLAQNQIGLGQYDGATRAFNVLISEIQEPSAVRAQALLGMADIASITGDFEHAMALLRRGVADAEQLQDAALLAQVHADLARAEWHRGNSVAAEQLVGQALIFARASGEMIHVADVLWLMGDLARGRGDVSEAETLFRQAIERYEELDAPLGIAKSLAKLAGTAKSRNDLDRAVEHYHAALEIYRAHGGRRGVAHQLNGLGDVARMRGDLSLAARHYRRAVDIFQSLRLPHDAAIALSNLGLAALGDHRLEEAEDALERALRVSERVAFAYLTLGVKLNLAHVLALTGNKERSDALLDEAMALADEAALVDPDYATPLEALAEIYVESGRHDRASEVLKRAGQMWHELGRAADLARVESKRRALPLAGPAIAD